MVNIQVTQEVTVLRDGELYDDWTLIEYGAALEVRTDIAAHHFVIHTGYVGPTGVAPPQSSAQAAPRSRL